MFGPGAFRLVLAILVVLHHSTTVRFGLFAVYAFFVLSGYWVTKLYLEKYRHMQFAPAVFLVSRFWRVAPVFLVCTVIAAVLYHRGLSPAQFARSTLLLLYNIYGYNLLPPAWTLDVEMQFYLLVPIIVLIRHAWPLLLVVPAVLWSAVPAVRLLPDSLLFYAPFFAIGIGLYVTSWRVAARGAAISLLAVLGYAVLRVSVPLPTPEVLGLTDKFNDGMMCLLAVPFIAFNVRQHSPRDKTLGDLSYIVYLFHWMPVYALRVHMGYYGGTDFGLRDAPAVLLAWIATATGSLLILHLVDRPSERIRAAFLRRRPVTAPAAAV
jgi:peptidoglycan/LPS O-acetylase OafA/YrhL